MALVKDDYRKWLIYSLDSTDPKKLYHLYKAIETSSSSGDVSLQKTMSEEKSLFSITCGTVRDGLMVDETGLQELKLYLQKNYIGQEDVEAWFKERVQNEARAKNYETPHNAEASDGRQKIVVKPHPKEIFYFNLRLVVSVLVYLALLGYLYITFMAGTLAAMLFTIAALGFGFWMVTTIAKGVFVGMIRGDSVRITKDQYAEIYATVQELAEKMDVKKLPEIYITQGPFNAFVMSFARSKVLMLYSQVVETALNGDDSVVRFVIAHELCHIKRRHLSNEMFLFPSRIVPLLYLAYSRAREYTCDRAGYLASPKGAVEGVLIMTAGKEIYMKFNVQKHIESALETQGFWTWFSEKFRTHPHHYKRLIAIRDYSR
ncbi:MAG TPA: M48 family metallopeptidase [Chryseosolibacter sp.]|nr:M48 family metallopeptidase [Chryseosolibacter sp.]